MLPLIILVAIALLSIVLNRSDTSSTQETAVVLAHDLPKPFGAHADGTAHSSKDLEYFFNTYHRCKNCHKVIRTYDDLHKPCNPSKENN